MDPSRPSSSLFDELRTSISGLQQGPSTSENLPELAISTTQKSALSLLAEVSFRHESLSALSSKEATPSPAPSRAGEPAELKEVVASLEVTKDKPEDVEKRGGRRGKRALKRFTPDDVVVEVSESILLL